MDRKDFLSLVGIGVTTVLYGNFIESCASNSSNPTSPPTLPQGGLTLDLTSSSNSALTQTNGSLLTSGLIVVHTTDTNYYALSSRCTHQGNTVQYDGANTRIHCPAHGSNFTLSGAVINGPASSPLQTYAVNLSGNQLHISP